MVHLPPSVAPLAAALHIRPEVPLVNIANALTTARLFLVPVFLLFLFAAGGHAGGWRTAAFAAFAVSAATDLLDGKIARDRGLVTPFGTMADPIADKALVGAALVGSTSWATCPSGSPW